MVVVFLDTAQRVLARVCDLAPASAPFLSKVSFETINIRVEKDLLLLPVLEIYINKEGEPRRQVEVGEDLDALKSRR